jgi:hypothetical protein
MPCYIFSIKHQQVINFNLQMRLKLKDDHNHTHIPSVFRQLIFSKNIKPLFNLPIINIFLKITFIPLQLHLTHRQ